MAEQGTRIAVVTGAGRGIGREIARHLARAGWTLAALARTDAEITETAALIAGDGGTARAFAVDMTDGAGVAAVLAQVEAEMGPVDLLVNNHGSFRAIGPIWDCDPDLWWRDVEINIRGTFLACRAVAPGMMARGGGRIVNLVGGGTGASFPFGSGYATSKTGIMRFTECLNDTTIAAGVRVFPVDPGLVRTAMTDWQLTSEAGKTYLTGLPQRFQEGLDVPPTRAAELIVDIARGRFDPLAGRLLRGVDDRDELERDMARLVARDGRALRFSDLW